MAIQDAFIKQLEAQIQHWKKQAARSSGATEERFRNGQTFRPAS